VKLTIPIEPVGQMRARSTAIGGHARTYKHVKQKHAENKLMAHAIQHAPETPFDCPLEITIDAYMPIPASMPKFRAEMARRGEIRPNKKPDLDNQIKHVLDAFNEVFWTDDKNIVGILARKFYSDVPRWEIEIRQAVHND
jgi:Holliday junction resolvase RusA-like endonuclease